MFFSWSSVLVGLMHVAAIWSAELPPDYRGFYLLPSSYYCPVSILYDGFIYMGKDQNGSTFIHCDWSFPGMGISSFYWTANVHKIDEQTGTLALELPALDDDAHLAFPFIRHHWTLKYMIPHSFVLVGPANKSVEFTPCHEDDTRRLGRASREKRSAVTTYTTSTTTTSVTASTSTFSPNPADLPQGCYVNEWSSHLRHFASIKLSSSWGPNPRPVLRFRYTARRVYYFIQAEYTLKSAADGQVILSLAPMDKHVFPFIEPLFDVKHHPEHSTLRVAGNDVYNFVPFRYYEPFSPRTCDRLHMDIYDS